MPWPDEQKADYLPRILRGEIHFAIGYTEPGAGTDLASLTTKAVRDGGDYVVNGQKIFTTGVHDADYLWLAARTAPDAPKHEGISVFIVETGAPGFKVTPIETLDDGRTNSCYFADVRVAASSMVGAENEGWKLITTQLNHERVALSRAGRIVRAYEDVLAWAKETGAIDRAWVRLTLARVRDRRGIDLRSLCGEPVTGSWAVGEVCLVASHLGGGGPARYETVAIQPVGA